MEILLISRLIFILILSFLIPGALITYFSSTILKDYIQKAKKFRKIQNLIEITKDEIRTLEKSLTIFITIFIALLIGINITNAWNLFAKLISGSFSIMSISCYYFILKLDRKKIRMLYILKDKIKNP